MTDPDALSPFDRRAKWRLFAGVVAAALLLSTYPAWVWVQGIDRRRAEALDARTDPLTAAELDELIQLADAPDPAARHTALEAAARRGDPRVEAIALRRSASPTRRTSPTGCVPWRWRGGTTTGRG